MKRTTQTFLAMLLVLTLLLSLVACTQEGEKTPEITTTPGQESTTPAATDGPTDPAAPVTTDPEPTVPEPTVPEQTTPVPTTPAPTTPPVAPMTFTKQPVDQSVGYLSAQLKFSVAVSGGTAPYKYQWYAETKKQSAATVDNIFADTSGANTEAVTLQVDSNSQSGTVWCEVTDANGTTIVSNKAKLKADAPLIFAKHPRGESVVSPCWVNFTVRVSGGAEPYKYQWYTDASGKVEAIPDDYEYAQGGRKEAVCFWVHNQYRTGSVWCVVKDADGKEITSEKAELNITNPLYISWHPTDVTAASGGSATFLVEAAGGTGPYTYQWYYNNGNGDVKVGTGTTLTLSGVTVEDSGAKIWCVATDAAGATDTSAIAVLTVKG